MTIPEAVTARLARLAPDQRAAATAPPGPTLCVAPAGSGKTTTLVARICWLVATGVDPATITAITFNKRAQEELAERLSGALAPLGLEAGAVRVRTFHALGREILVGAGRAVQLVDRDEVVLTLWPASTLADRRRLDQAFSRLKLDLRVDPGAIAADPAAGPIARAYVAYEAALADRSLADFDDLVAEALRLLETSAGELARWRRACSHLLVDEAQDLDRSQLDLALLLAAPGNRIFLVGDDDQSIYGWRLADVRRVLGLAASLPELRRVDLVTNYRCPATVIDRAVRLVEHNRERFAKQIRPRPTAPGDMIIGADSSDEIVRMRRLLDHWPDDGTTRAILARTNRELLPAAAVAVSLGRRFRAPRLRLLVEDEGVDELLDQIEPDADGALPLLVRVGRMRAHALSGPGRPARGGPSAVDDTTRRDEDPASRWELADAILGWAAAYRNLVDLRSAIRNVRESVANLRTDDADLTLATVHGTKGLEWDHVAVIGLETGRFPSARSIDDATEPDRALEEERRLAYVAWTRARQSLTLVFDPNAPSPFLLEAFDPEELGLDRGPDR
jgi:DNA helicase II / ATP-dependent DNA helicase PcrA